jgi:hypothetical protein
MGAHAYNPTLRRLSQEDQKFEASLGYTARPCLKNKNKKVPCFVTLRKIPPNPTNTARFSCQHISEKYFRVEYHTPPPHTTLYYHCLPTMIKSQHLLI